LKKYFQISALFLFIICCGYAQEKENDSLMSVEKIIKYPFTNTDSGVLYLDNPSKKQVLYNASIGRYIIREQIGKTSFSTPLYLTEEEYTKYKLKQDIQHYFKKKTAAIEGKTEEAEEAQKDLLPSAYVNNKIFESLFGGAEIKLVPRGSVTLRFGGLYQNIENPLLSEENRSSFTPEFDQQIRANLTASIGTRLKSEVNYDTQSTFSFQNQIKLEYEPGEDDLLRKLEVGNVNMNIKNNLISGSQALFGVKAQLQFGATTVTGVFSQQQSQAKNIIAEGGSALSEFELRASQYDNNRHFFIAQYFRNNYNTALENLPLVNSSVQITKIEVWITNRNTNTQDVRNVVGLVDLGESGTDVYDASQSNITNTTSVTSNSPATSQVPPFIPDNRVNSLNNFIGTDKTTLRKVQDVPGVLIDFEQGREYTIIENARKLKNTEFSYNTQLGYISLRSRLNDGDVLGIAFEYTYRGKVYRVGELSTDGIESDQNLVVKLIRPQLINTNDVVFNLLMKNVYNIGAFDLQKDGFRFDLLYRNDATGQATNNLFDAKTNTSDGSKVNINERTILNLTNLDRLDANNNITRNAIGTDIVKTGDGFFDFIEGLTVDSRNGAIIFPVIEPFGRDLGNLLIDQADKDKYVFKELYTTTASVAENDFQIKDKFLIRGQYTSSAADGIPLGAFNVPRGSVTVTAGGITLIEGVDYTVDYFAGRVKIINPAIESSGQAINVSLESNTFFNQQQKTFIGVDVEHKFSDKFVLGATYLNVSEKPLTQKVQFGQDPINNSMYGLNVNYSADLPVITDLVNYLPNIDTDAPSSISVRGDIAYLRPSTPSVVDIGGEATSYLDDFEGAQIPINLGNRQSWSMSSVPVGFDGKDFGIGTENMPVNRNGSVDSGKKRAKLSWYTIDQLFYTGSSLKPENIDPNELSRAEVRPIQSLELFPERSLDNTQRTNLQTFDLTYYPNERGPYNYEKPANLTSNTESEFKKIEKPETNWAGITRGLLTTDFQRSNIQYVEFWLQDPYANYSINDDEGFDVPTTLPVNQKGTLYLNLGSISEDILKDNRKGFENGLPQDGAPESIDISGDLADLPTTRSLLYAFGQGDEARRNQDVGYDGANNLREQVKFKDLESFKDVENLTTFSDLSSDDYRFFRGEDYDIQNASILTRYKDFNNPEGNSPTAELSKESYPTSATNNPDAEDADRDQTMNTVDAYWQYKVDLSQQNLSKSSNKFIIDERTTVVDLENGTQENFKWYLFRIPISGGRSIGGINSFQSIRFMRMFLTDFEIPVNLRFADLQMVRGDWRIYDQVIDENDNSDKRELIDVNNLIETGTVNIEENENRTPVNYVLPPAITRENLQGNSNILQQNEQSLTITATNLEEGNTIGVFKNINVDTRMFKRLKMFIHAEELISSNVDDDDLKAVIRLGSDTSDNFYQIEIPLKITDIRSGNIKSALQVWPEDNNLEVLLKDLTKVKIQRDNSVKNDPLTYSVVKLYTALNSDPTRTQIKIKGNPNLSNIRTLFLGVKNTSALPKSAEIWFNELRMSGFENQGGWATKVSADANLADFARIAVNGGYQSIGFGTIDQSVNERSQEEIKKYSVNTSINAGQLLPENWGLRIPVNYTVSEEVKTPKFDPKYEDVLSQDAKAQNVASENVDSTLKHRSFSVINVKKQRSRNILRKLMPYDIENFSASYSYSEAISENYVIQTDSRKNVDASLNYAYKFKQIEVTPLKKIKFLKNKKLRLLKDFNFNLLPSDIAINGAVKRTFNEFKSRDLAEVPGIKIPVLKQRNFMFDWDYRIGYQLTKAINLNFNATNSYIYDGFEYDENVSTEELDNIDLYSNFFNLGRANNYAQALTATYKIPIDKIPFLSFLSSDYSYTGNFNWRAASPTFMVDGESLIGNTINNGATHNLTGSLNFSKFYKEIGLRKLFKGADKKGIRTPRGRGKKKKTSIKDVIYGLLTSVKTGKISYNKNTSSSLDGYKPEIGFLGRNRYNGSLAPTLNYVLGLPSNILKESVNNEWLLFDKDDGTGATQVNYNKNFNETDFTSLNYDVTLKPIKDLNIQLTGDRSFSSSRQQQIVDKSSVSGEDVIINESGNFNISYSLVKTALNSNSDVLFDTFKDNRNKIFDKALLDESLVGVTNQVTIDRLGNQALNQQEVLIHSFLAAYSGNNVTNSNETIFKNIPIPNWTINYRGLMKLEFIKKRFSNFNISHGYNSSFTINNFSRNLKSEKSNPFQENSKFIYSGVTLVDAFSPLIKLDVRFKNSLSFRGIINTNRTLSLNLNNVSLSEISGQEYVFGAGYRIKDVKIKTKFLRQRRTLKGDINIKADVSYKRDITNIRTIGLGNDSNQPVGGQNLFGLKVAADYNLSRSFTASLYYDQNMSSYAISTLYPRQSVNAGLSLVYNLGN